MKVSTFSISPCYYVLSNQVKLIIYRHVTINNSARAQKLNKRVKIWYLSCTRKKKTILLLLLHFWLTSANSLEYWFKTFTRMMALLQNMQLIVSATEHSKQEKIQMTQCLKRRKKENGLKKLMQLLNLCIHASK